MKALAWCVLVLLSGVALGAIAFGFRSLGWRDGILWLVTCAVIIAGAYAASWSICTVSGACS